MSSASITDTTINPSTPLHMTFQFCKKPSDITTINDASPRYFWLYQTDPAYDGTVAAVHRAGTNPNGSQHTEARKLRKIKDENQSRESGEARSKRI